MGLWMAADRLIYSTSIIDNDVKSLGLYVVTREEWSRWWSGPADRVLVAWICSQKDDNGVAGFACLCCELYPRTSLEVDKSK